jgi:mannose-6-phosphate isomerase-like protein (cupin superfamily)
MLAPVGRVTTGIPSTRTWKVTRRRPPGKIRRVAIDYFSLVGDDGWTPLIVDPADRQYFWVDGGPLAAASVDVAATFDGAMWRSTKIDPGFNLIGLRARPNFVVPMRHHNLRQLTIVLGGDLVVDAGGRDRDASGPRTIRAGQFFVTGAGTPYTLTAGSDGVTFVETWPRPVSELETYWHASGWVMN